MAAAALWLLACGDDAGDAAPPVGLDGVAPPIPVGGGAIMEPIFTEETCAVGEMRTCACEPGTQGMQECIFDFRSPTRGVFDECKDCVAIEPDDDSCTMGMTRQCVCDNGDLGESVCVFDAKSPTQGTFSNCGACRPDDFDGGV